MRALKVAPGVFLVAILSAPLLAQRPSLSAEKLLTIGPGSKDGPYLLYQILAVNTDETGNIYALDALRARIMKFDRFGQFVSTIGTPVFDVANFEGHRKILSANKPETRDKIRASRMTGELYGPKSLFVNEKSILVLDIGKLVVYDTLGGLQRVIPLEQGPLSQAAFPDAQGKIVLLGLDAQGRMFHVLDGAGRFERSYGDKFAMPPEIAGKMTGDQKDVEIQIMSMPPAFSLGPKGDALLLSPFTYEIRIYRGENLWKTIKGPPPYRSGFAGFMHPNIDGKPAGLASGYIAPPVLLERDGLILVFQANDQGKGTAALLRSFRVDVFRGYEFSNTYDVELEGYPSHLSAAGLLYTFGSYTNPFINAYALKGLPGN